MNTGDGSLEITLLTIPYCNVSTFAGSGSAGSTDGTGTAASFNSPTGVALDGSGNIYIADQLNHLIRKITPAGVVTTFAGTGSAGSVDGTGTAASFNRPVGIAIDGSGNLFVTDFGSHLIRKITPAAVVTTFAGTGSTGSTNATGTAASFNNPFGLAIDNANNIYVSDQGNNLIRKITSAGVVTTFAGNGSAGSTNGTGTAASFRNPTDLGVDNSGNVYVSDYSNRLIRKITPAGVATTFSGTGSAGSANGSITAASYRGTYGIAFDGAGNMYVADPFNHSIRKISDDNCCALDADIPTAPRTFTSHTVVKEGNWVCYCDATNKLLLALDTTGSGAVISEDSVSLFIGANPTIKYSSDGGIIPNQSGRVVMDRKWNVAPTTQPTDNVKVKYYFTNNEYNNLRDSLVSSGTVLTAASDIQLYKLTSAGVFADPHASGATGLILTPGAAAINTWFYRTHGTDHEAEFLVSSFSGGGGGAGAGGAPLPVALLDFNAVKINQSKALVTWITSSEKDMSHFDVERSYDGKAFTKVGKREGQIYSATPMDYTFIDHGFNASQAIVYYRLKIVNINGTFAYSPIRVIVNNQGVTGATVNVFPNPVKDVLTVSLASNEGQSSTISITDMKGALVATHQMTEQNVQYVDMSRLKPGMYLVQVKTGDVIQNLKVSKD